MKALVVDDDPDTIDLLSYVLHREGYDVLAAIDGRQALARWEADRPDIVLLDANMPGLDGYEVCRRIRQASRTPVVMLTARDEEADVLRGLQLGADDYVTKPFSPKVLAGRMKAVLRRSRGDPYDEPAREVRVGDLVLSLDSYQATRAGAPVPLTRLEFRILFLLALNAGRVIPYSRLVEYAWGYFGEKDSSLLKSHICHLRQKLGFGPDDPAGIRAVLGVGYSLAA